MQAAGFGRQFQRAMYSLAATFRASASASRTSTYTTPATRASGFGTNVSTRQFTVWPRLASAVGVSAGEGTTQSGWVFRAGGAVLFGATAIAFGRWCLFTHTRLLS